MTTVIDQHVIFQPVVAMMILTASVWLYMYIRRISYMFANGIDAQSIPTPQALHSLIPDSVNHPSNNFKNLFEMPVLFYAFSIILFLSNAVDSTYVGLAWAYVGFRIGHSLVQCTFNTVIVRFTFFMLSCIVFWIMLFRYLLF